jgi:1-acyl-sn-glycerol-3-phosphate acyltransferase
MDKLENAAYGVSRELCRLTTHLMGYKLTVYGKEKIPEGRAIIASNHSSYLDPIFLGVAIGKLSFVSRDLNLEKSFGRGIINYWTDLIGVIKLDGRKIQRSVIIRILEKLKKGEKIAMFPEGTRSIDGRMGEFNDGSSLIAELSDTPVIPVLINGTYDIWPRDRGIKYSGNVRIDITEEIYLNKGIESKFARRKDMTDRIKTKLEERLALVNP